MGESLTVLPKRPLANELAVQKQCRVTNPVFAPIAIEIKIAAHFDPVTVNLSAAAVSSITAPNYKLMLVVWTERIIELRHAPGPTGADIDTTVSWAARRVTHLRHRHALPCSGAAHCSQSGVLHSRQ
jgi:hypothetical protein